MSATDQPEPGTDPLGPPVVPTAVGCLHCGREYDSYLIEWRVKFGPGGRPWGFWSCPTPGCDGKGFGFDILPLDPDYQDEHGGWVHDGGGCDDEEGAFGDDEESDGRPDDRLPY